MKLLQFAINSGSTFKQWEIGLRLARGKYIWIAESDDVSSPSFLSVGLSKLKQYDFLSVYFCPSTIIDKEDKEIGNTNCWYPSLFEPGRNSMIDGVVFVEQYLVRGCVLANASSALFRRPASYCFSFSQYKLMGDWVFWLNMCKNGKIFVDKNSYNFFRIHEQTVRSEKKNIAREELCKVFRHLSDNFRAEIEKEEAILKGYWSMLKFYSVNNGFSCFLENILAIVKFSHLNSFKGALCSIVFAKIKRHIGIAF